MFVDGLASKVRSLIAGKMIVFSDVDQTAREGKKNPSSHTRRALRRFERAGGVLIPITGAPLGHVPHSMGKLLALAENGGVLRLCNGGAINVLTSQEQQRAIMFLRMYLGLFATAGVHELPGFGPVALEGPRYASLTFVVGQHPDYPRVRSAGDVKKLEAYLGEVLKKHNLPLQRRVGTAARYAWVDVYACDKADIVAQLLDVMPGDIPYCGDGGNDLRAMQLDRITPVVFANSIPALHALAAKKGGLVINKAGPRGGLAYALSIISQGGR